eukprot:757603-Hanusia_phi.AAC.3
MSSCCELSHRPRALSASLQPVRCSIASADLTAALPILSSPEGLEPTELRGSLLTGAGPTAGTSPFLGVAISSLSCLTLSTGEEAIMPLDSSLPCLLAVSFVSLYGHLSTPNCLQTFLSTVAQRPCQSFLDSSSLSRLSPHQFLADGEQGHVEVTLQHLSSHNHGRPVAPHPRLPCLPPRKDGNVPVLRLLLRRSLRLRLLLLLLRVRLLLLPDRACVGETRVLGGRGGGGGRERAGAEGYKRSLLAVFERVPGATPLHHGAREHRKKRPGPVTVRNGLRGMALFRPALQLGREALPSPCRPRFPRVTLRSEVSSVGPRVPRPVVRHPGAGRREFVSEGVDLLQALMRIHHVQRPHGGAWTLVHAGTAESAS